VQLMSHQETARARASSVCGRGSTKPRRPR
jgi:hypothetical protein